MRAILLPVLCIAFLLCAPSPARGVEIPATLLAAAESGDASAQYAVGVLHANDRDEEPDYAQAAAWYRLAALQGHARAQRNLGVLCDVGLGVERDCREAAKWHGLAAEQGDVASCIALADMYASGRGVFAYPRPRHLLLARVFRTLLDAGAANPWELYRNAAEPVQDDARLAEALRARAERGDAAAQCSLGTMYEIGQGVGRSPAEAVTWYLKAAEQGSPQAQARMGYLRREGGLGLDVDHKEAFSWLEKATDQGHLSASLDLGQYHYLFKNYDRSYEYYLAPAKGGSVIAAERLASLMLGESFYGRHFAEPAWEWSGKAAEMGGANAGIFLFVLNASGIGDREKDLPKALEHLADGFEAGSTGQQPDEMLLDYLKFGPVPPIDAAVLEAMRPALSPSADMAAQALFGMLSLHGFGMEKDPEKALAAFINAARGDVASMEFLVGKLYDSHPAFADRRRECLQWYEQAADKGYGPASHRLGLLHENGDLVEKSDAKAASYYERVGQERGGAALDAAERLYNIRKSMFAAAHPGEEF